MYFNLVGTRDKIQTETCFYRLGVNMNIVVYLGSAFGHDPIYQKKIKELGNWIGRTGTDLVYGGSKIGLMGILADAVLEEGGHVTGVEPAFFIDQCRQHEGIDRLIVTKDMFERRQTMMEMGDAFIAFPGGLGTMEEITDIMSANQLNLIDKPYVIYNLGGYYDHFEALLDHMTEEGFLFEETRRKIIFCTDIKEIEQALFK